MRGLTDRQFAALACVAAHIRTHGFPPTLREIGAALNIGSTNGVNDHLKALTHKGYIARDFMASRGIRIAAAGREALGSADSDAARELRAFVDIARSGETPEVIVAFPEFAEQLGDIRTKYEALVAEVTADYERAREIESQKDFAREALKSRCSSALFCARNGKSASVRAHLQEMPADRMIDLLGLKDAPVVTQEAA